jgi:hypothetical protein
MSDFGGARHEGQNCSAILSAPLHGNSAQPSSALKVRQKFLMPAPAVSCRAMNWKTAYVLLERRSDQRRFKSSHPP